MSEPQADTRMAGVNIADKMVSVPESVDILSNYEL